jgi:hypothetical protein
MEVWIKALVEISILSSFRLIFPPHDQFRALEYDIDFVIHIHIRTKGNGTRPQMLSLMNHMLVQVNIM